MKYLLFILISIFFTLSINTESYAQGCVAIKSTGNNFNMKRPLYADSLGAWVISTNNRYFKSFRHFKAGVEQKERKTLGNQVFNYAYTMDLLLTRIINSRWSVSVDLPIISNTRSSLYEHKNLGRYKTHSTGVGDVRLAVYRWLFNPSKSMKGNIQLGLGIKLPTGDYKYQDYFHTTDSTTILAPVDQSIQLGDGGTGFTLEVNAYYNINHSVGFYGNLYYLSNPREQNGVSTTRGGIPSILSVKNGSTVMSVPDQYMLRTGVSYLVNNFMISMGVRDECLPVYDLIGGSGGFRRPGYIISAEPSVTYSYRAVTLYANLPVAVVRNRTQSVPDKIQTKLTGIHTNGDAAFADYAVNVGVSVRFK